MFEEFLGRGWRGGPIPLPFCIPGIGRGGPPCEDMRGPGDAIVGDPGGCEPDGVKPFVSNVGFGLVLFVILR